MITNLLLVSAIALLALPILIIGFLVETMQKKKLEQRRDEIARQSRQTIIIQNQTK